MANELFNAAKGAPPCDFAMERYVAALELEPSCGGMFGGLRLLKVQQFRNATMPEIS